MSSSDTRHNSQIKINIVRIVRKSRSAMFANYRLATPRSAIPHCVDSYRLSQQQTCSAKKFSPKSVSPQESLLESALHYSHATMFQIRFRTFAGGGGRREMRRR